MIIGAAVMLMAFAVGVYIVMGLIGWTVLKFIFGWGQQHPKGFLFIIAILGVGLLIFFVVGAVGLQMVNQALAIFALIALIILLVCIVK